MASAVEKENVVHPVNGFVRLLRPKEETVAEGRTVELTIRLERAGELLVDPDYYVESKLVN